MKIAGSLLLTTLVISSCGSAVFAQGAPPPAQQPSPQAAQPQLPAAQYKQPARKQVPGSITGMVTNLDGNAIQNASVMASKAGSPHVRFETKTDANGSSNSKI